MIIQQIEAVILMIISRGGRREVRYYIPQGMDGNRFSAFKNRNISLISYLKTRKDENGGKDKIIRTEEEEEFKSIQTYHLSFEPGAQEGFSDYLNLQEHRILGKIPKRNRKPV